MTSQKAARFTPRVRRSLEEFLSSDVCRERGMRLDELHGFLTALICNPELVMPSVWVPLVWGGGESGFESEEQLAATVDSLMLLYNDISRRLAEGSSRFEPILATPSGTGEPENLARGWCRGFMRGAGLQIDLWAEEIATRIEHLMFPIMALASNEDNEEYAMIHEEPRLFVGLADRLPDIAVALYDFWRRERDPCLDETAVERARAEKPGRNDPCPCGSGKKYKRCCGSSRN